MAPSRSSQEDSAKSEHMLDNLLSVQDAASSVRPKSVHYMTVHRWMRTGIKIGDRRIFLQYVRVGGVRYTKRRWLNEFFAKQQDNPVSAACFLTENRDETAAQLERELAQ